MQKINSTHPSIDVDLKVMLEGKDILYFNRVSRNFYVTAFMCCTCTFMCCTCKYTALANTLVSILLLDSSCLFVFALDVT